MRKGTHFNMNKHLPYWYQYKFFFLEICVKKVGLSYIPDCSELPPSFTTSLQGQGAWKMEKHSDRLKHSG